MVAFGDVRRRWSQRPRQNMNSVKRFEFSTLSLCNYQPRSDSVANMVLFSCGVCLRVPRQIHQPRETKDSTCGPNPYGSRHKARKNPSDNADLGFQAVGPALHIMQLNVEGLSAAKRHIFYAYEKKKNVITLEPLEISSQNFYRSKICVGRVWKWLHSDALWCADGDLT